MGVIAGGDKSFSLKDAEAFFKRFDGFGFHMSREEPDNYSRFKQMNIGEAALEKWRQELRDTRKNDGDSCGNIYNVGCMLPYMGYTPQTLDEILAFHGELGTEDAVNVETPNN